MSYAWMACQEPQQQKLGLAQRDPLALDGNFPSRLVDDDSVNLDYRLAFDHSGRGVNILGLGRMPAL
jgi:hypothetical protein